MTEPEIHYLNDGRALLIREAEEADAKALLDYAEAISGESDYLSFGPGEFVLTQAEEEDTLRRYRESDNQIYLVGLVEGTVVAALTFAAGHRPRTRHAGGFGLSVRKEWWGLGIGSRLLDVLLGWARAEGIVSKINLRVRTDNQRAIALYERKGFVIEGTISREILLEGEYHGTHWMGLEL